MITVSSKYALRAVVALKKELRDEYIQVKELAERLKIPAPYLSKVIKKLAKNNILQTKKGITGGVRLSRHGKTITIFEICEAMDEPIIKKSCFMSKLPCDPRSPCPIHQHWSGLKEKILQFLKKSTL